MWWLAKDIPNCFRTLMREIKKAKLDQLLEAERQFGDWPSDSALERDIALKIHRYIWVHVRGK